MAKRSDVAKALSDARDVVAYADKISKGIRLPVYIEALLRQAQRAIDYGNDKYTNLSKLSNELGKAIADHISKSDEARAVSIEVSQLCDDWNSAAQYAVDYDWAEYVPWRERK